MSTKNHLTRSALSKSGLRSLKDRLLTSSDDLTTLELRDNDARSSLNLDGEEEQAVHSSLLRAMLDASPQLMDASAAVVDDSFTRCFKSQADDPWNWNVYLFPLWCLGVVVRHCILFPLRLAFLLLSFVAFFIAFGSVQLVKDRPKKLALEGRLCALLCSAFTASWTAVIKYHGPRPVPRANHVWVANHSSMIDYIVLCSYSPFAVIMQLHPGWVGFLQTRVLGALGCLWFNRTEVKDRVLVAQRMREHVQDPNSTPLLIFPEGTCVNNEYTVMFKRGAFDMGAYVCPIAIKYNKIFVDAFWNSKRQSFGQHLAKLMSSWALVCDVYFLEPQKKGENESSTEFAERVQAMIAQKAGLKIAKWDGYLKYYNLGEKKPELVAKRQEVFAAALLPHLPK